MKSKLFDVKYLLISIVSAAIASFSIVNFTIPAKLYPAGFSGVSRLVSDISKDFYNVNLSYSLLYLIFNAIVVLFVFNKIGKKFLIYSFLQIALVSLFTAIFPQVFNVDDILLLSVFGGIINGIGSGIALMYNFSTGGTDFISTYFSNKFKKDIWNYTLVFNVLILVVAGFVYDWERALYSIIFQYVSTQIVKMMNQRYTFRTISIITKHPEIVSEAILINCRHGITKVDATGMYSQEPTSMLIIVANTFQCKLIQEVVLKVDPKAFITIQNTTAIKGNYYQKPLD